LKENIVGSGYVLSYKRDQGGWEEIAISPEQTEFVLSGLKCGSSYLAHLTAHNRVDTGDPSPLISATTKGTSKQNVSRVIKIYYKIPDSASNLSNVNFT